MPRSSSNPGGSSNKAPSETKGKSEGSPVTCQLPKDDREMFRARIEELGTGYTIQSVLFGLVKLWLDGKIDLPTPPERLKADAHAALAKLLDVDLTKAQEITRTLNDLSVAPQVIRQ